LVCADKVGVSDTILQIDNPTGIITILQIDNPTGIIKGKFLCRHCHNVIFADRKVVESVIAESG